MARILSARKIWLAVLISLALGGALSRGPSRTATAVPAVPADEWELIPLPVSPHWAGPLAVAPDDAATLYLGSAFGLFRSTNAGDSWTEVAPDVFSAAGPIAIAPTAPERLVILDPYTTFQRSDDGGDTWTPIPVPDGYCGLRFAPSDADRLYARRCHGTGPALLHSVDAGDSWDAPSPTFTASIQSFTIAPHDTNLILAAAGTSLHRSTDGGKTWATVAVGDVTLVQPLRYDPEPPHTLMVGHTAGVLFSRDDGVSWTNAALDIGMMVLQANPEDADSFFVSDAEGALRRVSLHGDRWRVSPAPAPGSYLAGMWRAVSDPRFIYTGYTMDFSLFWRMRLVPPGPPFDAFLPLIVRPDETRPGG